MISTPIRTLLAASLALAAAPVFATATSTATLSNFTYTLYDMDLNDGITPSINFIAYASGYGTRVTGQAESVNASPEAAGFDLTAPDSFAALAGMESTELSYAGAQVVGNGTLAGFQSLSAAGGAHGADGYSGKYSANAYVPYQYGDFTLTANTLVVFSATSTVSGSTSGSAYGAYGQNENAAAWTTMSVYGDGPSGSIPGSGSGDQYSSTSLYGLATSQFDGASGLTLADAQTLSERMSVSYLNLRPGEWNGTLAMNTQAWGGSNIAVTAVPEPQTYAMLLAGLMLLGSTARRQKRDR